MIFIGYICAVIYGILCLLVSFFAYKLGLAKKYTRKIVHILVGFEWVILYHTMGVGIHFLLVCLLFTAMLLVSYKRKTFDMISSESDNAPGTVYYGFSMSVMAILSMIFDRFVFAFGIAVFATSIGDGLAGVIGSLIKKCNPKMYKNKTLFGSISAVLFSFISTIVFSEIYSLNLGVFDAIWISLLAAGLELVCDKGLDNITLPLGVSVFAYSLMLAPETENYIVPIVLTPFIIALVSAKNLLTKRGIAAAVILDLTVSISLGNFGFVLLLSFLMLSVLIDKMKKHFKKGEESITQRGDVRDEVQVMANGFVPMLMALLYLLTGNFAFVIGYSAAIAEAFSDTSASGFGVFSKKAFDPFKMREVPQGLSGGMSLVGTVASLVMPALLLLIAVAFEAISINEWILCSVSAFFGAFIDSLLGSIIQAKYRCGICGKITEKNEHCGEKTELLSGVRIVSNDVVNLISAFVSAVLAAIICFFAFN